MLTEARLHSRTEIGSSVHVGFRAFRLACQGGGTPPDWTLKGDDPFSWVSPVDAAGGLIVLPPGEREWRIQPFIEGGVLQGLDAARSVGLDHTTVRAAYFSCGGAGVFLCREAGKSVIYVAREGAPRLGCREENMAQLGLVPKLC